MSDLDLIRENAAELVEMIGRPLKDLHISPVALDDQEEYLARLSFHVPPSYIPVASDDSGVFAIALWPGRDLLISPVVYVAHDEQGASFLCDPLQALPPAIWLWVSGYMKNDPDTLRRATNILTTTIPDGRSVKEGLWRFLARGPSRWDFKSEQANEGWAIADVGHPFAGVPPVNLMMEVDKALPLLESFVKARRNQPEVLAMYLAAKSKAGQPRHREDILSVLSAEAWRELGCMLRGFWRESGRGICEWDCTLKHTEDPEATFRGTPFEPLIGYPDTYSGEDKEGPTRLLAVADNFHKANDPAGELRQVRNAATLAILIAGEYPLDYAERIASVCDAIEKDSLAAAIARESARVHSQGP
jgi:hypothetical protein